jgi:hypothetical protein
MNESSKYPNEAFRVPEEYRNIPEKIEIFTLNKIIRQQGLENFRLLEKLAELEEKNVLLKGTLALVMSGNTGDA